LSTEYVTDGIPSPTDGHVVQTPISWDIEFPSYTCKSPDQFKKLVTARLSAPVVSGTVQGVVYYKTDERECWQSWCSFTKCAKDADCSGFACSGPVIYKPQPRRPIRLPEPPDEFDPVTNLNFRTGYEFQIRLQLTGNAEISDLRIYCLDEPEMLGLDRMDEDITTSTAPSTEAMLIVETSDGSSRILASQTGGDPEILTVTP
jgi:hypothetical protein